METLEIVQILEKKDFAHDEAMRLAEAINGNAALKTEFEEFKLQLDKKISRSDYKNDLDRIKIELKDFIDTKLTAQREIIEANLGKQLIEQKADTDKQLAEMKAKMETNQKWLMGLGIMLLGAILATNLPDLLKAFG